MGQALIAIPSCLYAHLANERTFQAHALFWRLSSGVPLFLVLPFEPLSTGFLGFIC